MCSPPTDARRKARAAARASTSISAPPIGKADEDAERRAAHTHGNAPSSTCIPAADGARRRSRAADYSESSKVGESSTCSRAPSLGKRLLPWCTTIFSDVSLVERKANVYGLFDEEEEEEEEEAESLFYCVAPECRSGVEEDHQTHAAGHDTLLIRFLGGGGGGYLRVIGDEPWSWFVGGIESIPVEKGKGKLVPLRPPSGRRCKTCADVLVAAESALFCTFQCKARSGEVAGHRWAQDLLLDDFAVPCERFDRVCWVLLWSLLW
ncbi:Os01g0240150 [Oryza sativa Japonica Group]|uniref:Os01g0240150 protein n=1 Tax=Oryza sativa subsp. japonica TaxID=39947 RepID=A0A0N7KCM9_ORYSJ|nr:Os01g0240150 [Oryza sativa Japonica Group]